MFKKFIERMFCMHPNWNRDPVNEHWRWHDEKYTCDCCGKSIYTDFENRPVSKDKAT